MTWKKLGYKAILEIMMQSCPDVPKKLSVDDKIRLSTIFESIYWNESTSVRVSTTNGDYFAEYVVLTPSIGVLKRNKYKLFHPALPLLQQEAFEATDVGAIMKIFLYFDTKWWKNNDQAFSFFWNEEDLNSKEEVWVTKFRYILKLPNNPRVWVGWVTGDLVP